MEGHRNHAGAFVHLVSSFAVVADTTETVTHPFNPNGNGATDLGRA